MTVLWR